MGIPTVALPCLDDAQAAHPAHRQSLDRLREMGVLIGSRGAPPSEAGGGADRFRREKALELPETRMKQDGTTLGGPAPR